MARPARTARTAMLAVSGINDLEVSRHCEPTGRANARPMINSAKQSTYPRCKMDCFVAALLAITAESIYALGLFDRFTQHFKLQPPVLCLLQFPLGFCKLIRGLIELLAILLEQIGIIKMPLLVCDLGL